MRAKYILVILLVFISLYIYGTPILEHTNDSILLYDSIIDTLQKRLLDVEEQLSNGDVLYLNINTNSDDTEFVSWFGILVQVLLGVVTGIIVPFYISRRNEETIDEKLNHAQELHNSILLIFQQKNETTKENRKNIRYKK